MRTGAPERSIAHDLAWRVRRLHPPRRLPYRDTIGTIATSAQAILRRPPPLTSELGIRMTHRPVLVCGTGAFAARIVFDIAATADLPVEVVIAGRNRERLAWLRTAAAARAAMFGRPATFVTRAVDLLQAETPLALLDAVRPSVIVQAASVQTSAVIATKGDAWSRLVAEGGLSATAVFQAVLTTRVAAAQTELGLDAAFINSSFADVVNGLVEALGHRVTCGMGNVAILSNAFAAQSRVLRTRAAEGARPLPNDRSMASSRRGALRGYTPGSSSMTRRSRMCSRRFRAVRLTAGAGHRDLRRERRALDPGSRCGRAVARPRSGPGWPAGRISGEA